jgi:outer membrane protein assembly factor BamB
MSSASAPAPRPRRENWWGCLGIAASLLGLGLCVGVALALTVFEQLPNSLDRDLLLTPGEAALYRATYPDGSLGFLSQNTVRPTSEGAAYAAVYADGGAAVQVRSLFTNWQGQGEAYAREDFYAHDGQELRWIAQHPPDGKIVFDRAIPVWSPALFRANVSAPWTSETTINGNPLRIRQWPLGDQAVTLSDGRTFTATRIEAEVWLNDQLFDRSTGWYVRNLGLVRSEEYDADGALILHLELLNSTRLADLAQRGVLPTPAGNATAFYRGNAARTGAHLDAALSSPSLAVTHRYSGAAAFTASPIFADGLVYVADQNGQLAALEADLSAPGWTFGTGGAIVAAPAIADGRLFFGASDKVLYALDAANGLYLWSVRLGDNIAASPVVANGMVFAACEDRTLYALDAQSGAQRWTFTAGDRIVSSPAFADGRLLFGADDQLVYALDAQSGRELWRAAMDSAIVTAPAVADGVAYAASTDRSVAAFDVNTGQSLWTVETRFGYLASPALGRSAVFVADQDGDVRALDRKTGEMLWEWIGEYDVSFVSSPLLLGSSLVAIDDDGILRVWDAATGEEQSQIELGSSLTASPTWNGATLFVATQDKEVLALEP